jgi:hypothetical protein
VQKRVKHTKIKEIDQASELQSQVALSYMSKPYYPYIEQLKLSSILNEIHPVCGPSKFKTTVELNNDITSI